MWLDISIKIAAFSLDNLLEGVKNEDDDAEEKRLAEEKTEEERIEDTVAKCKLFIK